ILEGQLEAGEPKEDTHPEDPCPGAGADTEKTAVAAEVPERTPLQQQITRLDQELGRQESLWADVHRKLQSHTDALRKQNLELREELKALVRPQGKAEKKPAASPHAGRGSHTLALEPAFEKISPLSADEEKKPRYTGCRSRSATLLGQRSSSNNLALPEASLRNSEWTKQPKPAPPPKTPRSSRRDVSGRTPNCFHASCETRGFPVDTREQSISLRQGHATDADMKKEEVREENGHAEGQADERRWSECPGAVHAAPSRR
uniref:Uncharacterized protein n=1 Tax=Aotus nancymaae TaxID=37293 RepID=A0A2K5CCW4_AOTNA